MEFYVIRHGQTDWNIEGRIQGHTNTKLNQIGLTQAQEISKKFEDIKIDLIISSPLTRCLDTVQYISKNKNLPILIDNRLIERGFGDFEGMDNLSPYNCNINTLLDYFLNYNQYHVEPIQDLFKRVHEFIDYCNEIYSCKKLLISTHGGVAQVFESILNQYSLETDLESLSLENGDYRLYSFPEKQLER